MAGTFAAPTGGYNYGRMTGTANYYEMQSVGSPNGRIAESDCRAIQEPTSVVVTLSSGAITLYNTTTSTSEPVSWSNPTGDGKTWLVAFTGSDIVGGSLPDGIYNLVIHHANVSGITMSSNVTYAFHRLFGDVNGDGTVNAVDSAAFNQALLVQYDPAFDYNADSALTASDNLQLKHRLNAGTTYTYTPQGAFLVGPSTTAPVTSTDISSWSAPDANDFFYSGSNVIEERQSGATGHWRQEVWGLGYVNSLIEQDTATAVDSGGVLPTSHFQQYSLDTSFNGTGVKVTSTSGSYDSVALQSNGQVVVAGVAGSNLTITRYNPNGALDGGFGTGGVVTLAETSPSFCKLAIDSNGNVVVAVNSGSTVQVSRLSGTDGSLDTTFNSTGHMTLTFATSVVPQGLAIDSNGKIVVAGDSSSGTGIYLARVTSSGSVDTTFGSSGYVNAPLSGAPSGLSLAFDSSGNILIAGSDGGDFSVVRLTSSGSLDTSFNTTGEVTVNMGGTDTAYAVSPGPAGTIVAAGVSVQSGSNYDALIRLTSAGARHDLQFDWKDPRLLRQRHDPRHPRPDERRNPRRRRCQQRHRPKGLDVHARRRGRHCVRLRRHTDRQQRRDGVWLGGCQRRDAAHRRRRQLRRRRGPGRIRAGLASALCPTGRELQRHGNGRFERQRRAAESARFLWQYDHPERDVDAAVGPVQHAGRLPGHVARRRKRAVSHAEPGLQRGAGEVV